MSWSWWFLLAYIAIDQCLRWRTRYWEREGKRLTTLLMHLRFAAWEMDLREDGLAA